MSTIQSAPRFGHIATNNARFSARQPMGISANSQTEAPESQSELTDTGRLVKRLGKLLLVAIGVVFGIKFIARSGVGKWFNSLFQDHKLFRQIKEWKQSPLPGVFEGVEQSAKAGRQPRTIRARFAAENKENAKLTIIGKTSTKEVEVPFAALPKKLRELMTRNPELN